MPTIGRAAAKQSYLAPHDSGIPVAGSGSWRPLLRLGASPLLHVGWLHHTGYTKSNGSGNLHTSWHVARLNAGGVIRCLLRHTKKGPESGFPDSRFAARTHANRLINTVLPACLQVPAGRLTSWTPLMPHLPRSAQACPSLRGGCVICVCQCTSGIRPLRYLIHHITRAASFRLCLCSPCFPTLPYAPLCFLPPLLCSCSPVATNSQMAAKAVQDTNP